MERKVSGFHSIALTCNNFLLKSSSRKGCRPFVIDGVTVGLVRRDFAGTILKENKVFVSEGKNIAFAPHLVTVEHRSLAMAAVLSQWRAQGEFECLEGWRNETYWVTAGDFHSPAVLKLERSAVGIFGFRSFGCHLNGYTKDPVTGEIKLWVGRRSPTKQTWPNCLDNFVAGGLPYGMGIRQNLLKECEEEAGLSPEIARKCVSTGAVSYFAELPHGLSPEIQFVFDLELPHDFVPRAVDGEVGAFLHLSVDEIMQKIVTEEYKPNCALILVDFLIRKGIITAENEPRYLEILSGIHVDLYHLDSLLAAPALDE